MFSLRNIGTKFLLLFALFLAHNVYGQDKFDPEQIQWPTGGAGCVYAPGSNTCVAPGSMVYPSAGMAKSSGSAWVTPSYADLVALFASGSCIGYLKNDGTCSTVAGMVYPSAGMAKSSGSAWLTPSFSDIVAMWASGSCTSGYLKFDGTCATPAGGGSTLPTSQTIEGSGMCMFTDSSGTAGATVTANTVYAQLYAAYGSLGCAGNSAGGSTPLPGTMYATALSGNSLMLDVADIQVFPNTSIDPPNSGALDYYIQAGFGDTFVSEGIIGWIGNVGNPVDDYTGSLTAMLAWLGTPRQAKGYANNSALCSTTGTWTAMTSVRSGVGLMGATGATMTCTTPYPASGALYLTWLATHNGTAAASLTIDSVSSGTMSSGVLGAIASQPGNSTAWYGKRYSLTGSGTHTFTITVTTGSFGFAFFTAPNPSNSWQSLNYPQVTIAGIQRKSGDGDSSTGITYSDIASGIVNQGVLDGFNVHYSDLRAAWPESYSGVTSYYEFAGGTYADGTVCAASTLGSPHPGDCGHLWNAYANLKARGKTYHAPTNPSGGTVTYTANQTASASDTGKLVVMNCSGACAYTLPNPQPSPTWRADVVTVGSTNATIALGSSITYNLASPVPVLNKWRMMRVYANTTTATDYEGEAPLVASTNMTNTPASNGLSQSSSATGGVCGAGNIPCTNTSNNYTSGTQKVATGSPTTVGVQIQATTGTLPATLVQTVGTSSGGGVSLTVTAGNDLIAICTTDSGFQGTQSVSDTLGNTWTAVGAEGGFGSPPSGSNVWITYSASGGSDTVTCGNKSVVQEWSGLAHSAFLDGTANAFSSPTSPQVANLTTTTSVMLETILIRHGNGGGTFSSETVATGYSAAGTVSGQIDSQYKTVSSGSQSATWTYSSTTPSNNMGVYIFAVKTFGSSPQTANLQEHLDASAAVMSSINNVGQYVNTSQAGMPSNTPSVGTQSYNTTLNCLAVYRSSGWACVSGGAISLTASNSAALNFTTCITSAARDYRIRFSDVLPATATANLLIQFSTDGGSTYDSTSGHYTNGGGQGGLVQSLAWAGYSASAGTGVYMGGYGTTADGPVSGEAILFNLPNSTASKRATYAWVADGNPNSIYTTGGTNYNQTAAVNAIRVISSSGNITSGTVTCQPLP